MRFLKSKKSFTILELSVVLVVIGFMLTGALGALQVGTKIYRERENKRKMERIQMALRGFFAREGRLPMPAGLAMTSSNANFGKEGNFDSMQKNQTIGTTQTVDSYINIGMVPFSSLGLSKEDAFDVYGNKFTYIVHKSISDANGTIYSIDNISYKKSMYEKKLNTSPCQRGSSYCPAGNYYAVKLVKADDSGTDPKYLFPYNLKVRNNQNNQDIAGSINNVAYALINHGPNASCAYNVTGSNPAIPTTNEKYNCHLYWGAGTYAFYESGTSADIPMILYQGGKSDDFDDIVVWESLESLFLSGQEIDKYAKAGSSNSGDPWIKNGNSVYLANTTDNVGIGTNNPSQKLTVIGNLKTENGTSNSVNFFKGSVVIGYNGYTGIIGLTGSEDPFVYNINFPLIVSSPATAGPFINGYLLQTSSTSVVSERSHMYDPIMPNHGREIAIYSIGDIFTKNTIIIGSDSRVKKDFSISDSSKDLEIIRKLEVTNYKKIDGNNNFEKKMIAQQVEKFYPQAISKTFGIIPNVFSVQKISKIEQKKDFFFLEIQLDKEYDLEKGNILKFHYKNNEEFRGSVADINKTKLIIKINNNFKYDKKFDKIFLYGKEINDLRALDYDAISMLNVSATQEIDKKLTKLEEKILKLDKNDNNFEENDLKIQNSQKKLENKFLQIAIVIGLFSILLIILNFLIIKFIINKKLQNINIA